MRNIRKNGLNKSLLVCTVLVFAVITLFVVMSVGQQSAIAEAAEHQTNNMTDFFVGPYGKNSFFRADEGLLIRNDDAIVNYIDKTYFTAPCQKLFIGNRYGYFIYTFDDGYVDDGDWVQTGNMRSIVLGFDIDFSPKGQASTKDAFGYKIEIIFQREFVTLMPNGLGTVGLGDFNNGGAETSKTINKFLESTYKYSIGCAIQGSISNTNGLVAPVPQKQGDDYAFEDVKVFYLSDIIVSANIFNAQDLNVGDTGYNVEADNGCFFIGTGFDLIGVEHIVEEADVAGFAIHSADVVAKKIITTVLGMGGPVGALINSALEIWEYVTSADDCFGSEYFEPVTAGDYYGTKDVPNSKAAQVEIAGGLYRSAAIQMKQASGSSVWLGQNNQYEAIFEVGTSTGNEPGWYTGVERIIDMSVVSLLTDFPTITASSELYTNTFNSLRGKPISEDAASEAYVRGNDGDVEGKDSFAFTAPRNGLYEVSLTNGTGVNYQVKNDVDKTVREPISGGMYYFEEGQEYIIELTNTTSSLKRPTVKVGMATLEASVGDSIELTLPAGAVVGLKVNFEDAFADVTITGDNARIYGLTANGFMPEEGAYTTNLDQIGSGIKYLWVENSAGQAQTVTIAFADIPLVLSGTGGTYAFDGVGEDYYTVVKFDLDDSYIYCLELTMSVSEASPDFIVYNSDGVINTANRTPSADNKRFTYLLNVGSGAGYLAVRGGGTYTVGMSTSGEAGDWYINGELVSTYSYDGYGAVILEQFDDKNAEYTVQYITKSGTIINELNYIGDNVGIDFNPSSGIITITPNSPYTRQNVYFTRNGNVANPLKLTFAVRRGPGFYFEYTRTPLMLKLHYDASSPLDEVTLTAGTHTYTFDCAGKNGVIDLSSQIKTDFYDAFVLSATFAVSSYTMLYSESATYTQHPGGHLGDAFALVSYDTGLIPYAGGNGLLWNPYQITTRAELEYMGKHNQALASYALMNDIDLSGANWTPIPTFSGILLGNGHAITNMRIHIADTSDTLQRYGFIGVNEGMIYGLTFKNAYITAGNLHYTGWVDVGIVAGYNEATINECSVNGTLEIHRNNSNIGGIVGENAGTVSTCKFGELHSSKVMGNGEIGGIAGKNTSLVSNCQVFNTEINFWEVYQGRSIGGIVGYNPDGTITDCGILNSKFIFSGYDDGENAWLPSFGYIAGAMEGDSRLVRVGKTDDVTYDFSAVVPNDVVPFVKNWFKGGWGETGYRADTVYVE